MGHVMPRLGSHWAHEGIASLFNSIKRNGFEILYLTARPVGQSDFTRNYLYTLEQDGFKLPMGPMLMSPDRLVTSLKREVVYKKPQVTLPHFSYSKLQL